MLPYKSFGFLQIPLTLCQLVSGRSSNDDYSLTMDNNSDLMITLP